MKKQSLKAFRERVDYLALNRTREVAYRQHGANTLRLTV